MDAFATDIANGTFRPFGPTPGKAGLRAFSGSLGGFTGQSAGNYVPGAADVPDSWVMDRDGRGGNVVLDAVFDPSLGAMKRLKAYDRVAADGVTLAVADKRVRPLTLDTSLVYDQVFEGSFQVQLHANEPVPIFSPHPKSWVRSYRAEPAVPGGLTFLRDGADTIYVLAQVTQTIKLNVTYLAGAPYYSFVPEPGITPAQYPPAVRPQVPAALVEDARIVLARAGADGRDVGMTLEALNRYFRSFTEGDIPPPTEVESLYLALALGGHGCCRHRAFAYMVTAQAVGIPTRVVVNEAHAFVEVMLPSGSWHQVNLGGCGTYTINNPNGNPQYFPEAHDPRGEANSNEERQLPTLATFTNITESPPRIVKGERYFVNGTVESPGGRPVVGALIDVYLNETKESRGRVTGAGRTDAGGRFSVEARVPRELPARSYQLVARAVDGGGGTVRYVESWSDPEINVFAPTKFVLPLLAGAAGFPVNITGRLVDVDNNPVRGANVSWASAGTVRPIVVTDATGRFSVQAQYDAVGDVPVEFRFAGTQHHGPSAANATLRIASGALLIPPEAPTLARGETNVVGGSVAVAGVTLGGRPVRAIVNDANGSSRVLASGEGATDEEGAFGVPVALDARLAPGVYPIRYEVPSLRLNATGLVRIAIRPTLEVEAPATLGERDAWVARVTVRSDNGTLLPLGLVEVTLDDNRSSARALLTNRSGVARFEFPGGLDVGGHTLQVVFPGDALHAEARETQAIEVVRPWFASIPPWAYALALGGVLLVGGAAWLLRPGTSARERADLLLALRAEPRVFLRVSFPDHPDGVAPVIEPGGDTAVRVRAVRKDGTPVRARLVALTPSGRETGRSDWTFRVRAEHEGDIVVRVRGAGLARAWTEPVEAVVPAWPWRRAVERGFVELRERAKLDAAASPGDLVRALARRLPPERHARLREAAALFEVADYSEAPVDRAFYHAFALARRDLERALEGPHGG